MAIRTNKPDEIEDELVGSALERREDPALVTGEAEYTDDIQYPGMVHMAVHRSQYGHARIEDIDTSAAEALDGVLAVYTYDDIAASDAPGHLPAAEQDYSITPDHPVLADGKVRYQGEPIAAVIAEDRYTASEAADRIDVAYERLDAVVDPEVAIENEDVPTIHEDAPDNLGINWERGDEAAVESAFESADHTVSVELRNNRLIPTAMEPRAAVARYRESTGELTLEMTSQNPHHHQQDLAETLGIPEGKIRVRAPDVGGGFGSKIHRYSEEALAAWTAMRLDKPVKWQATRTEGFLSTAHGRDHKTYAEAAFNDAGDIKALRVKTYAGIGGYMSSVQAGVAGDSYARMLCGQYDIPEFYGQVLGAFTNTTPVDAYRGAGRPEASYTIERLIHQAATELDMDPTEIRRRNFIPDEAFPYRSPAGRTYDSGEYEKTLDTALEHVDYETLRKRQEDIRDEDRYLGIGISCYVEACGVGPGLFESGLVRFKPSGGVVVQSGTHSHGQGHETSYAQIVAEELGVPYEDIEVVEGDTAEVPEGSGTYGSRSAPVAGSAIVNSAAKVREQARTYAAHRLEADEEDIEFEDGEFFVAGAPDRSMHIQTIADEMYAANAIPEELEPGLEATSFYDPEYYTFPFGTHIAVVEVDPESGEVEFEDYVAVDDVGNQINPKIVEGQIHGGIAQGLGQALYEGAEYDDNGTLITGSLQDYAIPKAKHMPTIEWDSTVTPAQHNPLGVKGVGEAGTIASPSAIVNAVIDALEPFGVEELDMPLTPETVWSAIQNSTD